MKIKEGGPAHFPGLREQQLLRAVASSGEGRAFVALCKSPSRRGERGVGGRVAALVYGRS